MDRKKLLIILLFVFLAGCVKAGENGKNNQGCIREDILQERELVQTMEDIVTISKEINAVCEKMIEAGRIGALNIAEDMLQSSVPSDEAAEKVEETGAAGVESEVIQSRLSTEKGKAEAIITDKAEKVSPNLESEPASQPSQQPELEIQEAVSYNPENVVKLAIAKCKEAGMVTTEEHLRDNLDAGRITQEEYDEYYPLDGLEESYYGVFVNVDLNKATTTSGRILGSEEAIAQYIADMMLLETELVFNIRYIGTYSTSGETFYEFRCYR